MLEEALADIDRSLKAADVPTTTADNDDKVWHHVTSCVGGAIIDYLL